MPRKATHPQREDNYSAHTATGSMVTSACAAAVDHQNLAELVWKHFAEEITQAVHEAQQALAPKKKFSALAKSQKR